MNFFEKLDYQEEYATLKQVDIGYFSCLRVKMDFI